jgi:hypothetical protein
MASPPPSAGWAIPLVSYGATCVRTVTDYLSSSPEPSTIIPGLEKAVEPLSFIITIALRTFVADGYKPRLEHYHIKWDPPNEAKLANTARLSFQGWDRYSAGELASRDIINEWEQHTEKAIQWYRPQVQAGKIEEELSLSALMNELIEQEAKPQKEGVDIKIQSDQEAAPLLSEGQKSFSDSHLQKMELALKERLEQKRRRQISGLFKIAMDGFEKTKSPYNECQEPKTKDLLKKLDQCRKQISNILEGVSRPPVEEQDNIFVEGLTRIWDCQSIEMIHSYFEELNKLKELKRIKNPLELKLLYDTIDAIEAIVNQKCTLFALIQKERREKY